VGRPGTAITVEARTANTEAGLAAAAFTAVSNGVKFAKTGRYIEVRTTLSASAAGAGPVLSDVRIKTSERTGTFSCQATALNMAGIISTRADPPDVPCVDDPETLANVQLSAGILTVRANVLDARGPTRRRTTWSVHGPRRATTRRRPPGSTRRGSAAPPRPARPSPSRPSCSTRCSPTSWSVRRRPTWRAVPVRSDRASHR
jgi:hypothetical protein